MYNKTNNLSVDMMIDLTIQINFMYKHNVTDLVCIDFYFDERGQKKPEKWKNGIWNTPITGIKQLCNGYSFKDNC